jgi:hypothetical protein
MPAAAFWIGDGPSVPCGDIARCNKGCNPPYRHGLGQEWRVTLILGRRTPWDAETEDCEGARSVRAIGKEPDFCSLGQLRVGATPGRHIDHLVDGHE